MEITFFRGLIPATFPALLGLILGAVVWIPLGWSQILPLQLVFVWLLPVFWAQSKTRASAFFLVFGYYLVASRDVPAMSQSFTSLSLFFAWLLILVYAGVIAVFWAVAWQRRLAHRAAGLCAVLVMTSLPPMGGCVVASPLLSAGLLFPNWGFWGIAATTASWYLCMVFTQKSNAKKQPCQNLYALVCVLALGASTANLTFQLPEPLGIQGVNTDFPRYPKNQELSYRRQFRLTEIALQAMDTPYPIVALPEAIAGRWEPRMQWLWQDVASQYQAAGKTLVLGVEVAAKDGLSFTNTAKFMGQYTGEVHARVPALVGSWHPWLVPHGAMRWFEPSTFTLPYQQNISDHFKGGQNNVVNIAVFFCWEEMVAWPWIWRALDDRSQTSTALILVNHWFASGLDVGDMQERSSQAWSRLFGWPVVRVVNASADLNTPIQEKKKTTLGSP